MRTPRDWASGAWLRRTGVVTTADDHAALSLAPSPPGGAYNRPVGSSANWAEIDMAEVRRIVFQAMAGRNVRVFVFGSRARSDARDRSDLDLAISASPALRPGELSELRAQLEEANILLRVDLVDIAEASPALRERILQEGGEWHAPSNV